MTILSLSNRFIEGYVNLPSIIGSQSRIEVKRNSDIQGTLDSIKELMDLKGKLKCNLKITWKGDFTRYNFINGTMNSSELEDKLEVICKEFC